MKDKTRIIVNIPKDVLNQLFPTVPGLNPWEMANDPPRCQMYRSNQPQQTSIQPQQ